MSVKERGTFDLEHQQEILQGEEKYHCQREDKAEEDHHQLEEKVTEVDQ